MYKPTKPARTTAKINNAVTGETIEQKMRRVTQLKEPITDGAPIVYTDRKDGVEPQYDIRTDRFEIAVDAMDKVQKAKIAQRENYMKVVKDEPAAPDAEGGKVGEA